MKINDFIEGIQILSKYYDKPNGYHIGAEHDVFYVYSTDRQVATEDLNKLCELGWFQDADTGDEDEFKPEHYDPEEGWQAFM